MVDGLPERWRAAGAAIRDRVGERVDTALATVDVAAVVFTMRGIFSRRHVLAEARRHLLETLRGGAYVPGIDSHIADRALERYCRQLTVPQKGRRTPAPDQLSYTADFAWPIRWWIAGTDGTPPRESSRYERARVASLALQNAIRAALTAPPAVRDEAAAATASATPPVGETPAQRAAAIQAHQQAAMPQEYLEGRTTDPRDVDDLTAEPRPYRRAHPRSSGPRPHGRRAGGPDEAGAAGPCRRPGQSAAAPHAPAGPGQGSSPGQ
ncbi:hypothetical protein [Streptomyces avermitilis]|uniref:hypothetical protein n=1 Tax=Streptomyces avermitilis TaxID=33903 RepID=UPI0037FD2600